MKTYEEKSQSVFAKIEQEKEARKSRKTTAFKTAAPFLSLCLAAVLAFGVWQTGVFQGAKDLSEKDNSALTEQKNDTVPQLISDTEDSVAINLLRESPSTTKMNIALWTDDFVKMDEAQLTEYYGANIFPAVPADLQITGKNVYGIYRRNGGTGKIYFDTTALLYASETVDRFISVEAAKGVMPLQYFTVDTPELKKSVIAGQEVVIGFDVVTDCYFVGMLHNGVGFSVSASGLSQEEFVSVIRSLIA